MREFGMAYEVPCDEDAKVNPDVLGVVIQHMRADFKAEAQKHGFDANAEFQMRETLHAEPHFALHRADGSCPEFEEIPDSYWTDGIIPEGYTQDFVGYSTRLGWYFATV